MVHADHGGHVVTHGAHGVVALVAVESPVAGFVGNEFHLAHLAHGHIRRHLGPAGGLRHGAAVGARDLELMTVDMDGVVGHGQIAHADAHLVTLTSHQRADSGEGAAVESPDIEIRHLVDARRHGAGLDRIGAEQEGIVALHLVDQRVGCLGVSDPQAHHAHGHLHHLIRMRVVHEGAGAARLELVDEGLARRDMGLVQAAHTVHAIGQTLAMPVDGGALGQAVGDEDAHLVAFHHLDRGARRLAVVAPHIDEEAGRHLAHHGLGHEVELLDARIHAPGRGPAVERDHGLVGATVGRRQRRGRVGAALHDGLGQGRHGNPADGH